MLNTDYVCFDCILIVVFELLDVVYDRCAGGSAREIHWN